VINLNDEISITRTQLDCISLIRASKATTARLYVCLCLVLWPKFRSKCILVCIFCIKKNTNPIKHMDTLQVIARSDDVFRSFGRKVKKWSEVQVGYGPKGFD